MELASSGNKSFLETSLELSGDRSRPSERLSWLELLRELEQKDEPAKSPLDKGEKAYDKFAKTQELTPELKKQFEEAIAEADKGKSPLLPALEKKVQEAEEALKKVYPEEKEKEAKKLTEEINEKLAKMPDEKKKAMAAEVKAAVKGTDADEKKVGEIVDKYIKEVAPGESEKLDKIMKEVTPAHDKWEAAARALHREKAADFHLRFMYGNALWLSGEKDDARKMIKDAVLKYPQSVESPAVQEALKAVGLDLLRKHTLEERKK